MSLNIAANAINSSINTLIVDGGRKDCDNLRLVLSRHFGLINIVGTAYDTNQATDLISAFMPDLVFLDINISEGDAFSFLERISPISFEIIFISAQDQHASSAFRWNAVDYLLKPVNLNDIQRAISKLVERLSYKRAKSFNPIPTYRIKTPQLPSEKIILKDQYFTEFTSPFDILFIEAKGSYSNVVFLKDNVEKKMLVTRSLSEFEKLLPSFFFRVHKSYLINCKYLTNIVRDDRPLVNVNNQYSLPIGRRRLQYLKTFLEKDMV